MAQRELTHCIYESEPPIARVIFNYPQKANALGPATVRDFDACLDMAQADLNIKVVVIKANGKGFCAGHEIGPDVYPEFNRDIEVMGTPYVAQSDLFLWPVLRLWEFPKPTIAQIHGYALGAGTYYAWLPDISIASPETVFQMPLMQSLAFPGGETMIEPWIFMNYKRAFQYLYTAQRLTAQQALEMGLLNEVVPREQLEDRVEAMASDIARAPLSTLMGAKTLVKRAWELMGMRVHLQMSNDWMGMLAMTKDAREFRDRLMAGGELPTKAVAKQGLATAEPQP